MISKQLTNLSILTLHLQLGLAEGYYSAQHFILVYQEGQWFEGFVGNLLRSGPGSAQASNKFSKVNEDKETLHVEYSIIVQEWGEDE
jgi:hypothetical protein